MLTLQVALEWLTYDPGTGVFRWNKKPNRRIRVGSIAGGITHDGYIRIKVAGEVVRAHRLAWFFMRGRWPDSHIDHINGLRTDNRISNLRECEPFENQQNLPAPKNRTSGLIGASLHKQTGRWHSRIKVRGVSHYLGLFDTPELAHEAYLAAKSTMHSFQPTPREDAK